MNTDQLTITPRARLSDPATSHDAAASVTDLTVKQQAVLKVFKAYGPLTQEQLVLRYEMHLNHEIGLNLPEQSPSGIRTRCSELVRKGKVQATSETRVLSTGRKGVVWRAVA